MEKLERIYTIPLGKAYESARNKRAPKAIKILRDFAVKHMKAEDGNVFLSEALNKYIWQRSIQKPPRKVKVRLIKDEGAVSAYLADEKIEKKQEKKIKTQTKAKEKPDTKNKEEKG